MTSRLCVRPGKIFPGTGSFFHVAAMLAASHVFLSCSDRDRKSADNAPPPASPAAALSPVDTCTLLDHEALRSALGAVPNSTKPSRFENRGLVVSSCYIDMSKPELSANVAVWQRSAKDDARDLGAHWEEMFPPEKLVDRPRAEGPAKVAPHKIDGLGRRALWSGDDRMNALHVLTDNFIIMVSVGSGGTKEERLERSKKLAEALLRQLP